MKLCVIYHPNLEFARQVEEFAHDFQARTSWAVDLVSLETKEGATMARLYDIVQYPAVVVLRDSGELIKNWQGSKLPLMSEVVSYL